MAKIIEAKPEYPKHMSPELKELLSKLLEPNYKKRASLEDILESRWIKG